jgi:hypothetical protein
MADSFRELHGASLGPVAELADADHDHDHPEDADRQHEHYDLAGIGHSHDFTHDHFGEYADAYHVHQQPWG